MGLRRILDRRNDVECVWLDIPFDLGTFGRIPALGKNWTLRGSVRARRAIDDAQRVRPLDALFIHTQTIGLFSAGPMERIPTLLSLDATPINYDELASWYGDKVHTAPIESAKLWLHRQVMRKPSCFTAWSAWTKNSLVSDYRVAPDKITVIHPGTVLSNFPDPASRAPHRGPMRVLFVGGDFRRKGGDLLLEVCRSRLAGKVELDLVTSADVVAAPGVRVHHGLKPHSPELLRRFAEADVFVLPTRGDCLAVVLGEAMASSLPIITTRVGAHAEAVQDGESGFVIDVDDANALADRLERLAGNPELCFRMGQRSRQIGEANFDMNKNANQIADILLQIASGPSVRAPA